MAKKKKVKESTKLSRGSKFATVMHHWGQGKQHSGSKHGPIVQHPDDQAQALAIAFSEEREHRKKKNAKAGQDWALTGFGKPGGAVGYGKGVEGTAKGD